MKDSAERPSFSLATAISLMVLGVAAVLVATLLAVVKRESDRAALDSAGTLFKEISEKTIANTDGMLATVSMLADTASLAFRGGNLLGAGVDLVADTPSFKAMLDGNGQLMSVYIGYGDGAFHQLIAARGNPVLLQAYQAPPDTQYIDRAIAVAPDGGRRQKWRFLDASLGELAARMDSHVEYDPRNRPWYIRARGEAGSIFTDPYVFSSSRLPGLTCARRLADGGGVFGVDLTLTQLGGMLADQKVARSGAVWILDRANRLVAYPGLAWEHALGDDPSLPAADKANQPMVRALAQGTVAQPASPEGISLVEAGGETFLASLTPVSRKHGLELAVAVAAPLKEITGHIGQMVFRIVLYAGGVLVLLVPLAMVLARGASRSVGKLVREAGKIQRFDFSPSPPVETGIKEFQELAKACEVMKTTIQSETENLERTGRKLTMLVRGGMALSAEKELKELMSTIFMTAQELAGADGGVMYLMEKGQLEVELLSLGSESLVLGGLSDNPAPRVMVQPRIMGFLSKDSVLRSACEAFNSREVVVVEGKELTLFPTGLSEEPSITPIRSLIAAPIVTRRDEVLGVIQLFNPDLRDARSETTGFLGSLAAQAAVTLDNRNLVNSLRELFDALIQVLAASIDAKSPYTAGHCTRVPELAEMLARAAHETQDGPLAGFRMESDDDWRQLWIAAWLHDCGKVTTPEYVVDKATKLETIYNRIHEVRMRFEVLRRDAEIDHWRRLAEGAEDSEALRRELEQTLRELEDDYAFVARCNIGGEFMTDEAKARVKQIAGRTWMRHFSDRVGLSNNELRSKDREPEPCLPAPEPLLTDKPEHIVPRTKNYSALKDAQGDRVPVPEYEYNRGEIYNLCIPRGTLTPEDRFKINEHTLSGMEMLGKIPFPNNLTRVTRIATEHHETLIGTGYPLKKSREHLCVESRILAIADIFEALTASDRPYKKAKPLSEALRIMSFMRNDQHIDADLFDIFLSEGIFLDYARTHLAPEQVDVENVSQYMSGGGKEPPASPH